MPVATMAPPTSPEANGNEIQDDFQRLLQHNGQNQAQQNPYAFENGSYMPPVPSTTFGAPAPDLGAWYMDQYGNKRFMYHEGGANTGGNPDFVSHPQAITQGKFHVWHRLRTSRPIMASQHSMRIMETPTRAKLYLSSM